MYVFAIFKLTNHKTIRVNRGRKQVARLQECHVLEQDNSKRLVNNKELEKSIILQRT